ncbi:hypothetical protein [Tenacibaculum jejuense]|uniref:Uncharacterized protein n=1 Tax=Tenacibaculum jejuense TaxID=584609 RepID=A0A238UDQ8_9FLAO|nr:hypothetical protein [Tenacibaculum jejuense]SNR16718.1 exported protein of unknown function [Tenacibaculum jejuense]
MKKITLIICLLLISTSLFSQNREGSIFYSFVEKTDTEYKISVDIYEVDKIEFIKVELVDENKNELVVETAELALREGKYYLKFNGEEKQVVPEDISLTIKNEYNDTKYPQINVKLLDKLLRIVDYSQKVFY